MLCTQPIATLLTHKRNARSLIDYVAAKTRIEQKGLNIGQASRCFQYRVGFAMRWGKNHLHSVSGAFDRSGGTSAACGSPMEHNYLFLKKQTPT